MRPQVRCTPRWRSQRSSLQNPRVGGGKKEEKMSLLRQIHLSNSRTAVFLFSTAEWDADRTCLAQKCRWARDAALRPEEAGAHWITASLQPLLPHGGAGKAVCTVSAPNDSVWWCPVPLLGSIGRKMHFPANLDSYFFLNFRWSKSGSGCVSDNQPSEPFHMSIS